MAQAAQSRTQGRVLSLRLPVQQLRRLQVLADYDGCSVAEEIRQAVTSHIDQRRRDPEQIARMRQDLDRRRREFEEDFVRPD